MLLRHLHILSEAAPSCLRSFLESVHIWIVSFHKLHMDSSVFQNPHTTSKDSNPCVSLETFGSHVQTGSILIGFPKPPFWRLPKNEACLCGASEDFQSHTGMGSVLQNSLEALYNSKSLMWFQKLSEALCNIQSLQKPHLILEASKISVQTNSVISGLPKRLLKSCDFQRFPKNEDCLHRASRIFQISVWIGSRKEGLVWLGDASDMWCSPLNHKWKKPWG